MYSKTLPLIVIVNLILISIHGFTCTATQDKPVIGNSAVICMHIHRENNVNITTYAFKTTVDTFSALKVNGLYQQILQSLNNLTGVVYVTVQPAYNNSITKTMIIADKINSYYRSVLSFVITLKQGNMTEIVDDNTDCTVCDTSNTQKCDTATNRCFDKTLSDVDTRFFISWIGTDGANNYMLSHTKRLSRFTQYSIGNLYQGLISQFKTT